MASPGEKKSAKLSDNLEKFDKRNALIMFKLTVARRSNAFSISHFHFRRPRKNADKET